MKKLIVLLALASAAAFAQQLHIVSEEPAPTEDISGFSGYAWGASEDYIQSTMAEQGYELTKKGDRDLWYRGTMLDQGVTIVYLFRNGLLNGGIWVFDNEELGNFMDVDQFLRKVYDTKAKMTIVIDGPIESEIDAPQAQARIIHILDGARSVGFRHTVQYYLVNGED